MQRKTAEKIHFQQEAGMAGTVLYLKAEQNAEVMEERVCVKAIASVYCRDKHLCA